VKKDRFPAAVALVVIFALGKTRRQIRIAFYGSLSCGSGSGLSELHRLKPIQYHRPVYRECTPNRLDRRNLIGIIHEERDDSAARHIPAPALSGFLPSMVMDCSVSEYYGTVLIDTYVGSRAVGSTTSFE